MALFGEYCFDYRRTDLQGLPEMQRPERIVEGVIAAGRF
jgi:hypothetical protein